MANNLDRISRNLTTTSNIPVNLDQLDNEIDAVNRMFADLPADGPDRNDALTRIGRQINTLKTQQLRMGADTATALESATRIIQILKETDHALADSGRLIAGLHEIHVRKTTTCAGRAFQHLGRALQPLGRLASWASNAAYDVGAAALSYVDDAANYVVGAAHNAIAQAFGRPQQQDNNPLPVPHQGRA